MRTELVLDALEMAIGQRRPDGVIHYSDQGSQYISLAFGKRCRLVQPAAAALSPDYRSPMAYPGDKSKYSDKQGRMADHIAEGYKERGVSEKEAERRA